MPRSFTNGCTYAYKTQGRTIQFKLIRFDPISRRHVVTSDGRNEWQIALHSLASRVYPVRGSKKMDTKQVYLYLCNIGDHTYKIGATCSPERRCKQIRTYTPLAKMKAVVRIPRDRGGQWSTIEKKVLRRFTTCRASSAGGREVMRFTPEEAVACAKYMRMACGN